MPKLKSVLKCLVWHIMGDHDDNQRPLRQSDLALRHGQEVTANRASVASDSLTSGVTAPHSFTAVLSADTGQAVADAVPRPVTLAAVSKGSVPDQVETSHGSFAALNKLLHSCTSGSPKTLKKEAKKGSALSDAQVQGISHVDWLHHC